MKEEWLFPGAVVPVTPETVVELINEIKYLIAVVGDMALKIADERETCAAMCEQLGIEGYGTLAIAAAIRGQK